MNIAGVLIHALPSRLCDLRQRLTELTGVDIHGDSVDGRLIVTIEDSPERQAADRLVDLHGLPGVLSATLVYHCFDDEAGSVAAG